MTQQELEKYLWGAATALRGTIDAGDYKQYIFPLLFFKRMVATSGAHPRRDAPAMPFSSTFKRAWIWAMVAPSRFGRTEFYSETRKAICAAR